MRHNKRRHLRIVHPNSQPIARNPRLRHLEDSGADFVAVANADLIVGQTIDREVLSKLSILKVIPAKFTLPIPIRFYLIDHNGTLFTAMASKISLAIAV
jgi:hypothetical protein